MNKAISDSNDTAIARFYRGKNVLVTGGSGFLGKVLLWKLYESCPGINKIFVLLRAKNDVSAHKRLVQMLKAAPFNIKHDFTHLLNKMVAIESDITSEGLGLSQADRSLLIEQVNIVFHSAASVSFDSPIKEKLRDNVTGTQEILKLCNQLTHLDALVHVSTAYANCHLKHVPEALVPLQMDANEAIHMIRSLPDATADDECSKMLEGRPNNYTYTKALAEHCVLKNEGKYPISIVRPSIIASSAHEPCPGWIDSMNGIGGLSCLAALGLVRTIDWNYYAISDVVPVDYVANCMICTAYDVHSRSPDKVQFYNLTSGNLNPLTWGQMFEKLRENAMARPPSKIVRPMIQVPKYRRANPISIKLIQIFSELLFAYMVDLLLALLGYKPILVKLTRRWHSGYKLMKHFTTNEWDFEVDNVINLADSLSDKEKKTFEFDLRDANWDDLAVSAWDGGKKYLMKEELTKEARQSCLTRQKIVTIVHYTGLVLFMASTAIVGYKVLTSLWLSSLLSPRSTT